MTKKQIALRYLKRIRCWIIGHEFEPEMGRHFLVPDHDRCCKCGLVKNYTMFKF